MESKFGGAYLLNPSRKEYIYEVTLENIKIHDSKNANLNKTTYKLHIALISESVIPFVKPNHVNIGEDLITGAVESMKKNSQKFLALKKNEPLGDPSLDKAEKTQPLFPKAYDLGNISSLGEGSFGCVLKIPILPEESKSYKNRQFIAVKIQKMVDDPNIAEWNSEIDSLDRSSQLNDYPKINPFALLYFNSYRIRLTKSNVKVLKDQLLKNCQIFKLPIKKEPRDVRIIETDFMLGGSLENIKTELRTEEISSIFFQITYSLIIMYNEFLLVHNDINPENILFQDIIKPENIRIHVKDKINFFLKLGSKEHSRLVNITDFGIASNNKFTNEILFEQAVVNQYGSGTREFMSPEYWLYYDVKKRISEQKLPLRNIASDFWALGLTLAIQALNSWNLIDSGYDKNKWPTLFQKKGIFQNIKITEILANDPKIINLNEQLENSLVTILPNPTVETPLPGTKEHIIDKERIATIISIIQFQRAIGNKFPKEPDESFRFGQVVKFLNKKMKDIESIGNDWKPNSKNNIFILVAERIKTRLGEDGFDFMKRCLSWSHQEREKFALTFLSKNNNSALGHKFFSEFQVDDFDYRPTSGDIKTLDYFFF